MALRLLSLVSPHFAKEFAMTTRRHFLGTSAGMSLSAGMGSFAFVEGLPAVSAQEVPRRIATVASDVEPLVRWIEDTPRNQLVDQAVQRIRNGTPYMQLLASLMLAGVRGIQPRPVGFKFHAVLVVNSAHLASLEARDRDRWLPLIWALDNFKVSQERNANEGNWRMPALEDAQLPSAHQAPERFRQAMDQWDETAADRAIARWAREGSLNEVYEAFWTYGARDFRDIGHKAIFVANSYRLLQTIGWRHAEPILRSLTYALMEHEGANPAQRDDERDRHGRENLRRLTRIRADWRAGNTSEANSREFLASLRASNPQEAAEAVVTHLNRNVSPASIWDGLFLRCGELLMQQPGIVGLHTVTTINALHFGYQTSRSDETRRFLMLQAASFLPQFRAAMGSRGQVQQNLRIDGVEPEPLQGDMANSADEIFADLSRDKMTAARKTLALLQRDPNAGSALLAASRRWTFAKGNDSHDYKFSSAALEDFFHVSPEWRNRFLAASMFWLKGSGGADTALVQRVRSALGGNGGR